VQSVPVTGIRLPVDVRQLGFAAAEAIGVGAVVVAHPPSTTAAVIMAVTRKLVSIGHLQVVADYIPRLLSHFNIMK
jgi:hypothetical protein